MCSGIRGKLKAGEFVCPRCAKNMQPDPDGKQNVVDLGEHGSIEVVDKFCHLRDLLYAEGGAESSSRHRVKCSWAKLRELRNNAWSVAEDEEENV